jgi:hypothetical protein
MELLLPVDIQLSILYDQEKPTPYSDWMIRDLMAKSLIYGFMTYKDRTKTLLIQRK